MAASRLHPRFGLEIRSRDVRQCTAADVDEIRDLLRQFGVLLFRDQLLTDEDLYRFSTAIGDGRTAESADRIALSPANAAISNLTNLHDDRHRPLGFGRNDTDYWHSDQEYRQSPATLASLYCLIPAERGGITSFATTRVAALNMPEDVLERLRGLKSTRRPAATHDNVDHIEVAHPVVLRDPIDDSEQLYVSELLVRFSGVNDDEGRALKQTILDCVLDEENIYRHEWRMGDLLLFDNAQLTHRREAFEGIRWLKATKIFAPRGKFAVPEGEVVSEAKTAAKVTAGMAMEQRTRNLIAETFQVYATGLAQPTPVLIRAGKAGGLAFDSLTTDVVVGCLPASHVCYGSCFAARESYRLGVDFGVRVENTLDEPLFRADLAQLPPRQRYLRNGWHSDPSWRWDLAARIATVIHDEHLHTVFVTKLFRAIPADVLPRLIAARAELRISVSALDTDVQLKHRLEAAVAYRDTGGLAIPVVVTTRYREESLNEKQDAIVRFLRERDVPGAENSLRFDPSAPIARLFETEAARPVDGVTDHWCGRLYAGELPVPTITSVPDGYVGLPYRHRSENDDQFMASLFDDPVPVWQEVLASGPIPRPRQAAVSRPSIDAAPRQAASSSGASSEAFSGAMSATIASRAM